MPFFSSLFWPHRGPQIYMRFLEYEMHNSNECKRNFVAIYDGSSSVEHLKNKFCSTVANDVMLSSSVGVVRLWADEGSRKSKFKILFTTFHERKCETTMQDKYAIWTLSVWPTLVWFLMI